MLYYDDARHANLYVVEPDGGDPDHLMITHPVDVVANTAVDTFVFGLGIGATMSYGTEVGELWFLPETEGKDAGTIPNAINWRGRQSVQAVLDQGRDPFTMLVDAAHSRGMKFIASLRLGSNNVKGHTQPVTPGTKGSRKGALETPSPNPKLDFTAVAARQERFALLKEALVKYEVDGLELDCDMGGGIMFEPQNLQAGVKILTAFVAQVRALVDAEAAKRGTQIALGLRVMPTVKGTLALGVDVRAILQAGLVDFIVPIFYVNEHMDPMMQVKPLANLAHENHAYCYPAVRPFQLKEPRMGIAGHASAAMYRATCVNYLDQGADALYMMQLNWPSCTVDDELRVLLCYCGEKALLHRMPRHYFIAPRQELPSTYEYDYASPLPMKLQVVGESGPGQSFGFYVGDDLKFSYAAGRLNTVLLRLRFESISTADEIEVCINGVRLPNAGRTFDQVSYSYAWIGFPMLAMSEKLLPLQGDNTFTVALKSRPPMLGGPCTLAECELLVEFVQQRNRTPYDLWRHVGGPSNSRL
eukprot:SAG31_NODE_2224_length_6150_cov_5.071724_1_plen_529_part_00